MFKHEVDPTINKVWSNKAEYNKSKVLGFELLCVESFYSQRQENKNT